MSDFLVLASMYGGDIASSITDFNRSIEFFNVITDMINADLSSDNSIESVNKLNWKEDLKLAEAKLDNIKNLKSKVLEATGDYPGMKDFDINQADAKLGHIKDKLNLLK